MQRHNQQLLQSQDSTQYPKLTHNFVQDGPFILLLPAILLLISCGFNLLFFELLGFNTFETINFNLLHFQLLDLKYNYLIIFFFFLYIYIYIYIDYRGPKTRTEACGSTRHGGEALRSQMTSSKSQEHTFKTTSEVSHAIQVRIQSMAHFDQQSPIR